MSGDYNLDRLLTVISGNRRGDGAPSTGAYASSITSLLPITGDERLMSVAGDLSGGRTDNPATQPDSKDSARLLAENLSALSRNVLQLVEATSKYANSVDANTKATVENTVSRLASRASEVANASQRFLGPLGGGLLASPLVSGLLHLFRRDKVEEQPDLVLHQAPPSVNLIAGLSRGVPGELTPVSYGQSDQPRTVSSRPTTDTSTLNITVNAIDSQSFLDHAEDIAHAMRRAMLNSHALSDVLRDF